VPAILGPTAVGKTDLALEIADRLGLEIISCDSRQIYRGMDIGTAKPSARERARICHWLIDCLEPSRQYSAYLFAQDAAAIIRDRARHKRTQLICGGAGLYFAALTQGLEPHGASKSAVREEYEALAREAGPEAVHALLRRIDPAAASRLHPNDLVRTIRALQIVRAGADPTASRRRGPDDMLFETVILTMDRARLYRRINARVDAMAASGLWEEFLALREAGHEQDAPGMRTVGYRELFAVQRGAMRFDEAIERIKRNTRRYAKRQFTWFARQTPGATVDIESSGARARILARLQRFCGDG
jgi:tRNA dimethylallyltransferase